MKRPLPPLLVLVALHALPPAGIGLSPASPARAQGASQAPALAQASSQAAAQGSKQSPAQVASPLPASAARRAPVVPIPLNLHVGQAHVIDEGPLKRIAVGNGKVVQATALDERQVLLIPEAPGQSVLHLWHRDGTERAYAITVTPSDATQLLGEIRAMLGAQSNVTARIVGDKVVLEGANLTEEQANRLAEIGKRYPQVVNLISRVGLERMIEMDVRMVEIKRDVLQSIGVKWASSAAGPSFGVLADVYRSPEFQPGGDAAAAGLPTAPRVWPPATFFGIATTIGSMINLLAQNGDAVVLAEPKLSCRSGGSARFVAGGEMPIPYSSGLGSVSVAFKEYGVKFDVSPVASETGVIAAKIATEISAINFEVQVRDVPGLSKRRAETEVNLREHETLVIAGLLSEETAGSVEKVPALGDLPILGKLFRSKQFRDRQTDLVVFVTPRFVGLHPGAAQAQAAQRRDAGREVRESLRMLD